MPEFKAVIDPSAPPITADQLCRCLTGMTISELAQDIARNPGGKYDDLYEPPVKKAG